MKRIAIIFFTITFGLPLCFRLAPAQEIHKWVDEKGVVHFEDDSGTIIMSVEPQTAATQKGDELARQRMEKEGTPNEGGGEAEALKRAQKKFGVPDVARGKAGPFAVTPGRQRSYYDAHPGEYQFELAYKEYLKNKSLEFEQKMHEIQREIQEEAAFQKKLDSIQRAQRAPSRLIETPSGAIDPQTGQFYPYTRNGIISPLTGQFMPDVGAGYRDLRTGKIIPKQ